MQQLLESNPHVWHWGAAVRPVQAKPEIVGPVIPNDTAVDEAGGFFPSVIRDNGIYRMWYNAWQWGPDNKLYISYALAYAESDDGVAWRKPALGLVAFNGRRDHNLVDLPFGGTSVFVDPTAPASHRYRSFGTADSRTAAGRMDGWSRKQVSYGHWTAHSADGLHWELDDELPRFIPGDTATACWDPWADCARYAFRKMRRYGGVWRRDVYTAEMRNGAFTPEVPADEAPGGALDELLEVGTGGRGHRDEGGPAIGTGDPDAVACPVRRGQCMSRTTWRTRSSRRSGWPCAPGCPGKLLGTGAAARYLVPVHTWVSIRPRPARVPRWQSLIPDHRSGTAAHHRVEAERNTACLTRSARRGVPAKQAGRIQRTVAATADLDDTTQEHDKMAVKEQFITDSKGKRTSVILSLRRYRQLVEDLHDLAIVAERRAEEPIGLDDVKRRLKRDGVL